MRINTKIETVQGSVNINGAFINYRNEDVALLELDLATKYARIFSIVENEYPTLMLYGDEKSLHVNEQHKENPTQVTFVDFNGWKFFTVGNPARYTIRVVLIKK